MCGGVTSKLQNSTCAVWNPKNLEQCLVGFCAILYTLEHIVNMNIAALFLFIP